MSTLTLLDAIERPSILGPDRDHHDHRHDDDVPAVGGTPTLDDLLTGTWNALVSGRAATCPLCDGPLEPRHGAGPAAVAGRCTRCATELS
jgi:hypothetical protein